MDAATACYRWQLEILRHAEAEERADVLAVERNFVEAGVGVHGDGIGLARARFEDDALGTKLNCLGFESEYDLATNAAAAEAGVDVHTFDLGDARFDHSDGAAANRFAIEIGDEKCAATFGDFFGIEPEEVGAFFGIAGFELGVESADK